MTSHAARRKPALDPRAPTDDRPGLSANSEFGASVPRSPEAADAAPVVGAAQEESAFPSIMTGDEVDHAAASRRTEPYDPYRRKERPDPWPIIAASFPRIAAKIRELWGKRALDDYFAKLVVDERGGRQGFPPEVLVAILEVARLHSDHHSFSRPMCPWEADVSQTKWWDRRR